MMRLQRIGRKNDPSYRVVVTDKRNGPRAGNHVDTIGTYNPKLGNFQIDAEKAKHWLSKGVQPSDTIYNFLITQGIIEGKKRNALPKKTPIVKEGGAEEKKTEEAPVAEKTDDAKPEEAPEAEVPAEEVKEETEAEPEPVVEEKKEEPVEETTVTTESEEEKVSEENK